jgi:acetyl esterase/lipase
VRPIYHPFTAEGQNGPKIKFQMPVSPTMDDRLDTESSRRYTDTRILNYYFLQRVWDNYLGQGHAEKEISPYAAPSRAQSYEGLPPCFLHIAEIDPHYDEAMLYVHRLQQAGVAVEWKEYDQCFHVFEIPCAKTSIGIKANNLLAQKLKEALADI